MLHSIRADLGYAIRMVRKTPLVSTVAVLSVGLGVAGIVCGFAVLNAWLLRPLPYPDGDRMVMLFATHRSGVPSEATATAADFFGWREQSTSFDRWLAQEIQIANLTGTERPVQTNAAYVTPTFFDVIGMPTLQGRTFVGAEGTPGGPPVAVIGEQLWRNRMGTDPNLVGGHIRLDGVAHTVVGIMPETFDFLYGNVDLWVPDTFEDRQHDRINRGLRVTARRRSDVTFEQAQSEMTGIADRLAAAYPQTHRDWRVNIETLREQFPGQTDASLAKIVMVVTSLTLLIACANVAGVLLAKADARQREFAVRAALGAGRGRIVQQLLTESVLLALLAGLLGVALVYATLPLIASAIPDIIPRMFAPTLDGPVAAFAAVVSILAGITFGISPAMHVLGGDRFIGLSDAARRASSSPARRRLGSALVIVEFGLALTILIGAGALIDLFGRSLRVDPGYDPSGILTVELAVPEYRHPDLADVTGHLDETERQLRSVTGVDDVTFASHLPRATNLPSAGMMIEGVTRDSTDAFRASWLAVDDGYFEMLGIPLHVGRTFTPADRRDAPRVAVVNQQFIDQHLNTGQPLGARILVADMAAEIVGVVPNVALTRLAGLTPIEPTVYFPLAQRPRRLVRALVQTDGDPMTLAASVQGAIWNVDAEQPVTGMQPLEAFIRAQLAGPEFLGRFVLVIGLLALSLAALGVYGIVAFTVSRQSAEIGVRMALGARPIMVLSRVARSGAVLAGLGLFIGTPAAFLVARAVMAVPAADIPGMGATVQISPMTIVGVGAVLIAVALIACLIPARHAARVDPASVLRED